MTLVVEVERQSPDAVLRLRGDLGAADLRVPRLRAQSLLATGHTSLVLDVHEAVVRGDGVELVAYVQRIYRLAGHRVELRGVELDLELELLLRGEVEPRPRVRSAATWAPGAPAPLPRVAG